MKYFCDTSRHLICVPYSLQNLHKMAEDLGIKRCWFHKDHYDIPKRRVDEITAKCSVVSSKYIVDIIRNSQKDFPKDAMWTVKKKFEYMIPYDWNS